MCKQGSKNITYNNKQYSEPEHVYCLSTVYLFTLLSKSLSIIQPD